MYKIVHYGDQPERTWALLNSYRSEFIHILWGTLDSYKKLRKGIQLTLLFKIPWFIVFTAIIFSGCSRSSLSIQKSEAKQARDECVVLLHGLARTSSSMDEMQQKLTAAGYHTVNLGYPSTSKTIEEIVAEDFPTALQQCLQFHPSSIHFVSHSLGGIILRAALKEEKPEKLGRVVMLSPPNHGSEITDTIGDWWFYRWLNGPAGQQLSTDKDSYPNQLGGVDYPVGVIIGDRYYFFDHWFSSLIPGADDGKVSLISARLEGMHDYLVVHETHPFIMGAEYVQDEVLHFLENGKFRHLETPELPTSGSGWFSFPSDK